MRLSNRIESLPPYLFAQISKIIAKKKEEGVDVISLGIGDPDLPTPQRIINKLVDAANIPANHRYQKVKVCLNFVKLSHHIIKVDIMLN